MTIQPDFSAFDLCSSTPATTPSPSRIISMVPTSSAPKNLIDLLQDRVAVKRNSIVIPGGKSAPLRCVAPSSLRYAQGQALSARGWGAKWLVGAHHRPPPEEAARRARAGIIASGTRAKAT